MAKARSKKAKPKKLADGKKLEKQRPLSAGTVTRGNRNPSGQGRSFLG